MWSCPLAKTHGLAGEDFSFLQPALRLLGEHIGTRLGTKAELKCRLDLINGVVLGSQQIESRMVVSARRG
ncbi:hypothetical protein D9M71_751010 [compost metagenome]